MTDDHQYGYRFQHCGIVTGQLDGKAVIQSDPLYSLFFISRTLTGVTVVKSYVLQMARYTPFVFTFPYNILIFFEKKNARNA